MNTPNPLIPQGSLLEQSARGKPHLRVACIIVAIHLIFLGGLLIQGCKREDQLSAKTGQQTNDLAQPALNPESLYGTNVAVQSTSPPPDLGQTGVFPSANPTPQNLSLSQTQGEPSAGAAREYVVVQGDSFSSIGKKLGVAWSAIAKANPGVDSTRLKVGQKLVIPASASLTAATPYEGTGSESVYVVKSNDSLFKIARANGTTVNDIKALNGLKTDRIKVGDKLKLPAARPAPVPGTATPAVTNPSTPTAPPPGSRSNL